jgi:large subunit ribosomal protein L4
MEVSVLNIQGEDTGKKIVLNDAIFGIEPNDHAIYLDVKQYLANQRQGTHKTKGRSEVAGSTRKLGRQKGGGGARPGDIKSPVRVGGGRVFGPVPRDYSFKLNKKVKQLARKSALSYKAKENLITVVDQIDFAAPKTKEMIAMTQKLQVADKKPLIILANGNKNVYLSARNLPKVNVVTVSELNTYIVLNAKTLVFTAEAVSAVEKIFKAEEV